MKVVRSRTLLDFVIAIDKSTAFKSHDVTRPTTMVKRLSSAGTFSVKI